MFVLINVDSAAARDTLYCIVDNFFANRSFTAFRICHQQSYILICGPTSPMSSLLCANLGLTPYLSRRHLAKALSVLCLFPMLIVVAVDSKQHARGKPALSYSPSTPLNFSNLCFLPSGKSACFF